MTKKIIITMLLAHFIASAYSQLAILPQITDEVCPGTNITFTATVPGLLILSVSATALNVNPTVIQQPFNISVSGSNVTFNFIGKFTDNNNKQTFTAYYVDANGQNVSHGFTFTKIKSLLIANSFSQIYPTPASITVQRCQSQAFNISFSNVKYGNPFEAPAISYGTVTNYEYLLPTGWKLGTTLSDGSTWISANNNVTVTPDLIHGDLGSIRIRPVNAGCGSGLVSGQEATPIAISRPAPTLTISAVTQDYICTNGTADYTITGMPTGSTVIWQVSNQTLATIISGITSQTATVQNFSSSNAVVTLTATVSDCITSYPASHDITLGTPNPNPIYLGSIDVTMGKLFVETDPPLPGATSYNWYKDGVLQTNHGSAAIISIKKNVCGVGYGINVAAINGCGTSGQTYLGVYVPPCSLSSYNLITTPNPATGNINLSIAKLTTATDESQTTLLSKSVSSLTTNNNLSLGSVSTTMIYLYDFYTNSLVKQWSYNEIESSKYTLNITGIKSGVYVLKVDRNNNTATTKIIIK